MISMTKMTATTIQNEVLTHRQFIVLSLSALGLKNRQIAQTLFVSENTVKKTLEIIFRKLCARDRTHAVAIAFGMGILTTQKLSEIDFKYKIKENFQIIN